MNLERDIFLEECMGECKHDFEPPNGWIKAYRCKHCLRVILSKPTPDLLRNLYTDFSTWDGFGLLWEWIQEQDWRNDFCREYMCAKTNTRDGIHYCSKYDLIDPDKFADALHDFLKEKTND